jgi:hypothetical protein
MTHKDSEWNRLIAFRVLLVVPQQSRPKSRPDARPPKEKVSDNLFHLTQVKSADRNAAAAVWNAKIRAYFFGNSPTSWLDQQRYTAQLKSNGTFAELDISNLRI